VLAEPFSRNVPARGHLGASPPALPRPAPSPPPFPRPR
jgi:hypothetical protein